MEGERERVCGGGQAEMLNAIIDLIDPGPRRPHTVSYRHLVKYLYVLGYCAWYSVHTDTDLPFAAARPAGVGSFCVKAGVVGRVGR
jgi:hypothetical protein